MTDEQAGNEETAPGDVVARIANEFAAVSVRRIGTGAGGRLELHSEYTGQRVHLDATVLEALCRFTPDDLTMLVTSADAGISRKGQPES